MDDLISRKRAIAVADFSDCVGLSVDDVKKVTDEVVKGLKRLPSAQPDVPDTNVGDMISRQAAIDAVCEHGTELERRGIMVLAVANHKQATVDLLESLPSAQPEIIRCKECKHSEQWYRKCRCFLWSETGIGVFEDGFCNYAERRTDGKTPD